MYDWNAYTQKNNKICKYTKLFLFIGLVIILVILYAFTSNLLIVAVTYISWIIFCLLVAEILFSINGFKFIKRVNETNRKELEQLKMDFEEGKYK